MKIVKIAIVVCIITSCVRTQKTTREIKLDYSNQKLNAIPDSVFNKTDLVYLNAGSNSITIYPPLSALVDTGLNNITAIPNKIGRLTHLKTLILNSNKLTSLPDSIIKLKELEVLDLSVNKELNIVQELNKLKELENLKLLKIFGADFDTKDTNLIKKTLPNTRIIVDFAEYAESFKQ